MNGIIVVKKEAGMTSRDVVNKISKIFKTKKVGHTGTLDPNATGVLVVCIGKATRLVEYITATEKVYHAEVTLGISTDTLDTDGEVIKREIVTGITSTDITKALCTLTGPIKQEVPIYSAVKINGRKLYEYARNNIPITLPIHDVTVFELDLLSDPVESDGCMKFPIRTRVSKGTYIRSLIRDIGGVLDVPACMSYLSRVKQGAFTLNQASTLEEIEQGNYTLYKLSEGLTTMTLKNASTEEIEDIKCGRKIKKTSDLEEFAYIDDQGELLAIYQTYQKDTEYWKPVKVFIN